MFVVQGFGGKRKLSGRLAVSGAKNAALKAMAATLLFSDTVKLNNVPDIEDVKRMAELLSDLGGDVKKVGAHSYTINTKGISKTDLDHTLSKRMRSSIILTGPILARFGKVSFPHPGGCVLGSRPIDLFLSGFKEMGGRSVLRKGRYRVSARGKKLKGIEFFFRKVSVTGTETLMMSAVLAEGKTTLKNAALEPEIEHLAEFLNSCGAKIKGAGTSTIEITGGGMLRARKKVYTTLPDRIEAGSFLILGAIAARRLEITKCKPEHLEILTTLLKESGVPISIKKGSIVVRTPRVRPSAFDVRTHEYPGFSTDLQAPMVVYLTQAKGECSVFETIFEGRLNYTEDLVHMGAHITMANPHNIAVKGPSKLEGRTLEGPDLRAGLAFVIAGIVAEGQSIIDNVYHIDRGYERIEERLRSIGVNIKRVSR